MMEVRRRGCIEVESSGALVVLSRYSAVEDGGMEHCEALQACRRGSMEVCRCSDLKIYSPGALEARCRRADVDAWRCGALETRYKHVDVGSMKLWERVVKGDAVETFEPLQAYGALEARCRCSDVEVCWYGYLEERCRGMEHWRKARRPGGMEAAAAVATWRLGGLEARCWRSDVEVGRYGVL